ncbi:MAG: DNA primase [Actinomycetota bacterium]|nr:DNA primase [Actinomycetota bacterium]
MGIVDEDVQRVRDATDIVALVGEHTQLKRAGKQFSARCPFHTERTPSFSVNPELGVYHCFGCGRGGDAITFVRELEQLDFVGAVERLAERAGISLRYDDNDGGASRRRNKTLLGLVERAAEWYHERLVRSPDAGAARAYLRSRGYDGDVVRRYRLGWAPDDWDALVRALRAPRDDLVESGLAFVNRRGRLQDFFRGRVLFPILNTHGEPVSFGGRLLPGATGGGKYINLSQTPLYDKSKVLYGLSWAKTAMVRRDEVVVCEGYTDVIGMHEIGIEHVVAPCGTSLTEEHISQLRNFAGRLVLAFDADAAGQAAAERVYEWEQKFDLDVRVADLPGGGDPADLAGEDPDGLRRAVEESRPFLGFRVDRVLSSQRLDSPEQQVRAATEALRAVAEHPNEMVRDQYVMEIADRCRISEPDRLRRVLRDLMAGTGPGAAPDRPAPAPPRRGGGHRGAIVAPSVPPGEPPRPRTHRRHPEREALRVAVADPETALPWLDAVLFHDPRYRSAYRALADAGTLQRAAEDADPETADLLWGLAQEESDASPAEMFLRLCRHVAERAFAAVEGRVAADGVGDVGEELRRISAIHMRLTDDAAPQEARLRSGEDLVVWLLEQAEGDE